MTRMLVLDFDNTMTDGEKEVGPFLVEFKEQTRIRANLSPKQFRVLYKEQAKRVIENPHRFGWQYNNELTAAAHVDVLAEARTICELIFEVTGAISDPGEREIEFERYFTELAHHQVQDGVFRWDTWDTLTTLQAKGCPHYIVTNSPAKSVTRRLRALDDGRGELDDLITNRTFAHARKYVLDPGFTGAGSKPLHLSGFSRALHTHRPLYFKVLDMLRQQHGMEWQDILVVGDIFEIDLALPYQLGSTVALIDHKRVPEYERDFIRTSKRAHLLEDFGDLLSLLD